MRRILTTLLLVLCGSGAFAQYMSGGLVSQGTLMSTQTEVIRSGFDIWAGGGFGFGAFMESDDIVGSYHININAGYNINPRMFVGGGIYSCKTSTNVSSLYLNMRSFVSRNLNSLYIDLRLGKIINGGVGEKITEQEHNGYVYSTDITYYKPQGLMGGYSMGYIWDRFALEWGFDFIGAVATDAEYYGTAEDIDWESDEYVSISAMVDFFIKAAYRF